MFSAALKTNDAVEKGIFIFFLRIARESTPLAGFSLFTGLNNFKVITIFDDKSNQQFVFTQKEMDSLLSDYQAEAYRDKVKDWSALPAHGVTDPSLVAVISTLLVGRA